jgi:hypothetical protein
MAEFINDFRTNVERYFIADIVVPTGKSVPAA